MVDGAILRLIHRVNACGDVNNAVLRGEQGVSTGNDAMNAPVPLDGRSSIGSRATVAQERPTEFDRPRGGREEQEGAFRGRGLQVRMRVRVAVVQVLEEHTGQLP